MTRRPHEPSPGGALEFRYELDAADRILRVDAAWLRFAWDNEAAELTAARVVGRSIWEFVSGGETRHLYRMLFDAARTGRPLRIPFRCDAPDRRRYMELQIEPTEAQGLRLTGRLLREELRPPVALLEADRPREGGFVVICSWCKRIRTEPGAWEEVEEAVRKLGLFDEAALPGLSHGICADCRTRLEAAIEGDPETAREG